jgi:NADH-quinone oxidoreductase subunit L
VAGAFLTGFYMTRQVALVFFGNRRSAAVPSRRSSEMESKHHRPHDLVAGSNAAAQESRAPHESPLVMTAPLMVLAFFAMALGFFGTPAWPWFQDFLGGQQGGTGFTSDVVKLMIASSAVVFAGLGLGWWLYGRKAVQTAGEPDVLEKLPLGMHAWFARKYGIDELYEMTVIRFNAWFARFCAFLDEWIWGGVVFLISYLIVGLGWVNDSFDKFVINFGFDQSCGGVSGGGKFMSRLQDGQVQNYLRVIGLALVALVLFLIWGGVK